MSTATLIARVAPDPSTVIANFGPGGNVIDGTQTVVVVATAATGPSGSGGGGSGLTATVHLDAAAMATLHSAPTQLVAPPGAGKAIGVVWAFAEFVQGVNTAWDTFTPALFYGSPGAAHQVTEIILDREFDLGSLVGQLGPVVHSSGGSPFPYKDRALVENQPLIVANVANDPHIAGAIVTSAVAAGGAGYAPGDTGTITDISSDAAYVVDTVGGGGSVLTYHLTNPGTLPGYSTEDNPLPTTPTSGAGDGNFTVNITAITTPIDGDLYITVLYQILDLH